MDPAAQPLGVFGIFWYLWHNWSSIKDQWGAIIQAFITLVGMLVTLSSMITPLTSTPKDDDALKHVKNWLHQFSVTNAKDVAGVGQDDAVLPWKQNPPTA